MRIDLQAFRFVVARAERLTQIGTHITAQNWIDDVEDFTRPVAHGRYYLPTLTAQGLQGEIGRRIPAFDNSSACGFQGPLPFSSSSVTFREYVRKNNAFLTASSALPRTAMRRSDASKPSQIGQYRTSLSPTASSSPATGPLRSISPLASTTFSALRTI